MNEPHFQEKHNSPFRLFRDTLWILRLCIHVDFGALPPNPWEELWQNKKVPGRFAYFGLFLAMFNNFWQWHMKIFLNFKNVDSGGMLLQDFKPIGQEITSLYPLIFERVNKMPHPIIYSKIHYPIIYYGF